IVGIEEILFVRSNGEAVGTGRRRTAAVEDAPGGVGSPLLEVAVHQPHVRVSASGRRAASLLRPLGAYSNGLLVRLDHFVPHACSEVNVRRHMEGMRGGGRDGEVLRGRGQTET